MGQPFGQRCAQALGTHLITGQPDRLEQRQQMLPVIARFAAGLLTRPLWIGRQAFDRVFAIVTAHLAIFVENFAFIKPPAALIPAPDLQEILPLGLQTHNTIFPGVLLYESTNGFAAQQYSSPGVFYYESTRNRCSPKSLLTSLDSLIVSALL